MSESFVTQCPHCQSSFRVSHNQLSVARGVVRCGSCLQVFNAARQLLEQSATLTPANLPRPPELAPRPWTNSDIDLDRLELGDAPRMDSLSARRDDADADADTAALPPIIERLPALDEDQTPAPARRTEPSFSHPEPLDETHVDDEPSVDGHGRLSALDEHDRDEPPAAASTTTRKVQASRNEPALRDEDDLADLLDEPMQLAWEKPRSHWGKRLLWLGLAIVAALGLGVQYLVYHFAELARQDQYRPLFQQLCPVIGCSVPAKVDIALVKSSNLVVRSHPEFAGALVVDAIIYNRAAFAQPFPLLELRFADLNGQLIASRRFKPSEYLDGELAGKAEMPPQTPIHIALDILDPGPAAVNYSLSFRSPE
ncbi:DUF3426 domain-containing protein [Pseudomonas sp. CFBP 8770]|uniref:DUF3426 domain-containing protein n=1 Tax=unclassified Pseudomonas TaxID=196821 RepID=UPI001782D646|nr:MULTISPECIES: DUF3426 domain-containing protein [unclassified Pseudomonas]MBD8474072.1 DUF3426 domain-containing protein [Pseudomonas sp. CFBP 8773]MBD8647201.1 DUF3426 domain-containing protein [Pseudomonas sp. CFBP 8770]